jgi:hypothetical protein
MSLLVHPGKMFIEILTFSAGELYTNNDSLVTMPHGKKFKKMRKLFNKNLNGKECLESYQPIQDAESVMLLKHILDGAIPDPSKEEFVLETCIDRFTASIMTCISYGRRIEEDNDELILEIRDRMQYMATLNVYVLIPSSNQC